MRDNPIDLEKEVIQAQKQLERTRDTGAAMADTGTYKNLGINKRG